MTCRENDRKAFYFLQESVWLHVELWVDIEALRA